MRVYSRLSLLLCFTFNCWNLAAGLTAPNRLLNFGRQQRPSSSSCTFQLSAVHKASSSLPDESFPSRRRRKFLQEGFFKSVTVTLAAAVAASTALPQPSNAEVQLDEADDDLVDVYFGCGCFWHIQREFVQLEKSLLQRSDLQLTSRAGYAGGGKRSVDGKVCYHNAAQIGDYGALGHAEVVSMQIPKSTFTQFAAEYCSLFSKDGYRPDQMGDRGPEYRNLVGLPGGVKSPLAKQLVDASIQNGDKLDFAKGKGGGTDPDARGLVFIMDTDDFPFYVAEQYHQFHDGFNFGENYPNSYNDIAGKLAKEGTLGQSACPNGLLGLGALGL